MSEAEEQRNVYNEELRERSDVRIYLAMNRYHFQAWYDKTRNGIMALLGPYQVIKVIPDLKTRNPIGMLQNSIGDRKEVNQLVKSLGDALSFVETIKRLRED